MADENAQDAVDATAEEIPPETPAAAVSGAPDDPEAGQKPTDFAPPSVDLVIADPVDEQAVITALDSNDELQILAELEKQPERYLAYEFPQGGQKVIGMSYEGITETIRQMNGIGGSIPPGKVRIAIDRGTMECISVEEDLGDGPEPCWQATVYAYDEVTGHGGYGTFIQRKWSPLKSGTAEKREKAGKPVYEVGGEKKMPNPFSRQTALGKAQRNAYNLFVPVRVREGLLAKVRKDTALRKTILSGAGAEAMAALPPPLTDDRALAQKAEARQLYDELRGLPGFDLTAMTPAAFHVHLTRNEHDHDRLDDFLKGLRTRIEEATPAEGAS